MEYRRLEGRHRLSAFQVVPLQTKKSKIGMTLRLLVARVLQRRSTSYGNCVPCCHVTKYKLFSRSLHQEPSLPVHGKQQHQDPEAHVRKP